MTPAELLLAAADRIDQARAQATPGPWKTSHDELGNDWSLFVGHHDIAWISDDDPMAGADAAWIALLNPDTGGHIADLLRGVAQLIDEDAPIHADWLELPVRPALVLARAILGGDT